MRWIGVRLKKNIRDINRSSSDSKLRTREPHICWGDIGGNIRSGGGKMYFIDWEFSSVSSSTELGYIKIHSHPTSKQFRQIVKLYAECSGISQEDILDGIKLGEKVTRVNDVIWAAMKCGQAETLKDIKKFKQLTYKRMEIYKKAGFK